MCNPTAQDYHSPNRADDLGIGDEHQLLRHCCPPVQIVPCPINGQKISDQAFKGKKTDAGLSVELECLLSKDDLDWQDRYGAMPGSLALLAVSAADARANSAGVAWTPKPQEDLNGYAGQANPYHGEIIHPMTGQQSRALFRRAVVLRTSLAA